MDQSQEPSAAKALEQRLQEEEEALQSYRSLVKLPGWGRLHKELTAQVNLRTNALMQALSPEVKAGPEELDGFSRVLRGEFEKGVRMGIILVMGYPAGRIGALEEDVTQMQQALESQVTNDD